MRKWLQQLMIISVAFVTLGVISPSHEIWSTLHEKEDVKETGHAGQNTPYTVLLDTSASVESERTNGFLSEQELLERARTSAFTKFGSKIGPAIENEFDNAIFPQIEQIIHEQLNESTQLNRQLTISKKPSSGQGEKIFNIKDSATNENILLFHVRTEKRPQDGYFFNFHYHLAQDEFQTHYALGDVYWSKNTPPKWLS